MGCGASRKTTDIEIPKPFPNDSNPDALENKGVNIQANSKNKITFFWLIRRKGYQNKSKTSNPRKRVASQ